jgi:hypothetical protein
MMGGSFNLPSGASSRDLRSQLSPISGSPSSKSSQGSLPASLSQPPSSVDQSKRTYPIAPLSMYAATEQIQAFQNRPSMMNFPTEITCADAWEGSLLVGTVDGLYVLEGAQETDPKLLEVKCQLQRNQPYRRNAYQQITIIEDLNIVLALIPKAGVVMYDLTCIAAHTQPPEMLLRKSKMATLSYETVEAPPNNGSEISMKAIRSAINDGIVFRSTLPHFAPVAGFACEYRRLTITYQCDVH